MIKNGIEGVIFDLTSISGVKSDHIVRNDNSYYYIRGRGCALTICEKDFRNIGKDLVIENLDNNSSNVLNTIKQLGLKYGFYRIVANKPKRISYLKSEGFISDAINPNELYFFCNK